MKVFVFFILLFAISFTDAKDVFEKKIDGFTSVFVRGRFTVELIQGDEFSVKYFIDDADVDTSNINFSLENNELTIHYKGGIANHVGLHFEITMPHIVAIHCKNGAELKMNNAFTMNTDVLKLTARNGGKMIARFDEVAELEAKISQGGAIRVHGKTEKATYEVYTGGSIAGINNLANHVFAKVNLGGEIICTANKTLEAHVTSGGTISYQGDAKVEERIRLGGNVEKL